MYGIHDWTDHDGRAKCTVIIRVWNFLTILMARHSKDIPKVSLLFLHPFSLLQMKDKQNRKQTQVYFIGKNTVMCFVYMQTETVVYHGW